MNDADLKLGDLAWFIAPVIEAVGTDDLPQYPSRMVITYVGPEIDKYRQVRASYPHPDGTPDDDTNATVVVPYGEAYRDKTSALAAFAGAARGQAALSRSAAVEWESLAARADSEAASTESPTRD